jgi:hypothetical protein
MACGIVKSYSCEGGRREGGREGGRAGEKECVVSGESGESVQEM